MLQAHLSKIKTINLGSFYTPDFVVNIAYDMLFKYIKKGDARDFMLLDSSCGYGNFLQSPLKYSTINFKQKIGVDIDEKAINFAKNKFVDSKDCILFLYSNSLYKLNRMKFNIKDDDKLIIIGNPPYNDRTSIVQNHIKNSADILIDSNLKSKDFGISFLLSYNELKADYICVLHPLSYLIKQSNFKTLKNFAKNYFLLDSLIINSKIFCPKSSGFFPILIALYKRDVCGMDYDYIKNYSFRTIEDKVIRLSHFDYISKYIDKYPNSKRVLESQKVVMIYTMRDINALRRSKTFITKTCSNAINVPESKYSLYCYVDVFKQIITHIPYYFGNCDILIDYPKFKDLESEFIKASKTKILTQNIINYFKNLFGEHYEN